jgi:hypothetical protein
MASVYSTRFVALHNGTLATYVVPADAVAVVRSISAFNNATVAHWANVKVQNGPALFVAILPANGSSPVGELSIRADLRQVLNAGQTLEVSTADPLVDVLVSGYLFL